MGKSNLKIKQDNTRENDLVYALVTTDSELKVCLVLNELFSINLALAEDIIISDKQGSRTFRRYIYEDDEGIEKFVLAVNKNEGNILFKELKQVDFLLLIKSDAHTQTRENLVTELKNSGSFTVINKLQPTQLKLYGYLDD